VINRMLEEDVEDVACTVDDMEVVRDLWFRGEDSREG
jgi:hypothetical protein